MLSLRQLRYFVSVARHRHFGRAADECGVSQPALSMQIQEMERFLGVQLIERRRGDIGLTEAGLEIDERARQILADVQDLADSAQRRKGLLTGPLRLGVIPSIAPYLLPTALPQLQATFPKLELALRETITRQLLEELADGRLDVALLSLPIEEAGLETMHLFEDAFVLAMPRSAANPRSPAPFSADALGSCNLLLLEEGHCLREQALNYCRAISPGIRNQFGATSLATIMQMVANGYGATLLPEISISTELRGEGRIDLVRFMSPAPTRSVGLAWRRSSPRGDDFRALGKVVAACGETVRELGAGRF